MKLHLPSSLRKALLACLAAFALPVSVGTSASIWGAGAFVSFILSDLSAAADVTITNLSEWNAAVGDGTLNAAGKTWDVSYPADDNGFYFREGGHTVAANINIVGNIIVKNGYSTTQDYNFTGDITGSEDCTWYYTGTPTNQHWVFQGDVSGFAGNFNIDSSNNGNNFSLRFEGSGSNTGSITISNAGSELLVRGATMLNSSIQTVKLVVDTRDSVFKVGTMAVSGDFTLAAGRSVTFAGYRENESSTIHFNGASTLNAGSTLIASGEGVNVSFSGALNLAENVQIRVEDSATLTLDAALELNSGKSLSVNGGNLHVNGLLTLNESGSLVVTDGSFIAEGAVMVSGGSFSVHDGQAYLGFGLIVNGGDVSFNGGETTVNNLQLLGGDINVLGGKTTLLGQTIVAEGTQLRVGAGGTLELGSGITRLDGGLRVEAGSRLVLQTGCVLEMDIADMPEGRLFFASNDELQGDLILSVLLPAYSQDIKRSFQLFADDSYKPFVNINFVGMDELPRGLGMDYDRDTGILSIVGEVEPADLTWDGGNLLWTVGSGGWVTTAVDKKFYAMDNVAFAGETVSYVTVSSPVVAGDVIVQSGNYTFVGDAELVVNGGGEIDALRIGSKATATIMNAALTAPRIEVESGAVLSLAGECVVSASGGLILQEGAETIVSTTGDKIFANAADAVGVQIAEGATLRVENIEGWQGVVQGEGALVLSKGGMQTSGYDLSDNSLGHLLSADAAVRSLRLEENTLVTTTAPDVQIERFNAIQEVYVTEGSAIGHRAGAEHGATPVGTMGNSSTTLYIEGYGHVNDNSYSGALLFGIAMAQDREYDFYFDGNLSLLDDARLYVHATENSLMRAYLYNGSDTGVLRTNGHTLIKNGSGELIFDINFATAADDEKGFINVDEGAIRFAYANAEALSGYGIIIERYARVILDAESESYTIGALSGAGVLELADDVESSTLVVVNDMTARDTNNVFQGVLPNGVNIEVQSGYQAINIKFSGETLLSVSHDATLDLEFAGVEQGAGNKLTVNVGSAPVEGDGDGAPGAPGTAGMLKLRDFVVSSGGTLELNLQSGSVADADRSFDLMGGAEGDAHLIIHSSGSELNLDQMSAAIGANIDVTLTQQSTLNMNQASFEDGTKMQITSSASLVNLRNIKGGSDSDGMELSVTLSNESVDDEGNMAVSYVDMNSASFSGASQVSLHLTDSTASLNYTAFAAGSTLTVTTDGESSLSLAHAQFGLTSEEEVSGPGVNAGALPSVVELTLSNGSHDLRYITAGENVAFGITLQDSAWVNLQETYAQSGLQILVKSASAVVESVELRLGSRVSSEVSTLTLAGANRIVLDSAMKDTNRQPRIFDINVEEIRLQENASLLIDISGVLSEVLSDPGQEYIYYVAEGDMRRWKDQLNFGAELALLNLSAKLREDGSLSLRALGVSEDAVYLSSRDNSGARGTLWGLTGNVYTSADEKVAIYIDKETHIDLRGSDRGDRTEGLVLSNLMGAAGGDLYVEGEGAGKSMVSISNNLSLLGIAQLEAVLKDQSDVNVDFHTYTFNGNLTLTGADLQIYHRDGNSGSMSMDSTTLVKGNLTIEDGWLMMTSGKLQLDGDGNDLGDVGIVFAGNNAQLVVTGETSIGGHVMLSSPGDLAEHILIDSPMATLSLKDGLHVDRGVIIGNDFTELLAGADTEESEGEILDGEELPEEPIVSPQTELLAGTVSAQKGEQYLEVGSRLRNVVLNLETGSKLNVVGEGGSEGNESSVALAAEYDDEEEAALPAGDWRLAGLTGSGALASTIEHEHGIDICVAGQDRHFSGDLSEYQGSMVVLSSSNTQYFDGVKGGAKWNLVNTDGGRVVFNLMGGTQPNSLSMGVLDLRAGSKTSILFDMSGLMSNNVLLSLQGLNIEDEAEVTIGQYKGTVSLQNSQIDPSTQQSIFSRVLGLINVENQENMSIGSGVIWHLTGIRNATEADLRVSEDGVIYLEAMVDNTNLYAPYATNENSATGAGLVWGVLNSAQLGGDIAAIDGLLYDLLLADKSAVSGEAKAQANQVMAAVAGASTAVLSEAVNTDMERQLHTIRNRTTSFSYGGDSYSRIHSGVWLNAEGNYHKQDADGLMPGYKLTGWGGTVGAHTQVGDSSTVGLALTAMYNDIESDGADRLKGDMDTYYLSGFAQLAHESWRHTFVMSIGRADLNMNRTVSYGEGAYTTHGSTDGLSFGLLYELGYTMPLNNDYSVCLQPVLNVTWRLNRLGAYTETGSNAALHVETQTYNAITFGAGARLQAAVGSNIWNRTGIFEGRALVKVDVGDRQGASSVSLQNVGAFRGDVKSAEKGAVGLELGAGITLPTGRRGEAFADFSAELRADYTNLNATIGYRINF